ncbi:MAG TPA: hypothetical protein DDY73_00825 [Coprobacter fastidiosus]|uniref:LTD domain-containing protein n=1 Tax=Coprobacter fastidiosus TaxID=1099853 RepID=A0A354LZ34_9BACT|nr:hypothetical protein [Coprobacter fastidiosus]
MNHNISKILACLLLSIWVFCSTAQNIKISEVFYDTPYEEDDNDSINVSHNGEFIEICNLEPYDVDLSGWGILSKYRYARQFSFQFPKGSILKSGETAIICHKDSTKDRTFKLSDLFPDISAEQESRIFYHDKFILANKRGSVYLKNSLFSLVDEVHYLGNAKSWDKKFTPYRNVSQAQANNGYSRDYLKSIQLNHNYYADSPTPFYADHKAIQAGIWGHELPESGEDYFTPLPVEGKETTGIPLNYQVSPSGIMEYNIPISTIPGRNGFQPDLSFNYQSIYRYNNMGTGWSIGGLSSIARTNKCIYYDGENGAISRGKDCPFSLDGIRLIKTEENENEIYFRTVSGNIRVTGYVSNGDIERFKVFFPDGIIGDYETPNGPESRIEYPIVRKTSIRGDIMDFEYITFGNMLFISKISYGKNKDLDHFASIQFDYINGESRFDFKMVTKFTLGKKLTKVTSRFKNHIRAEYKLEYGNDRKLTSIHNTIDGKELIPIRFRYEYNNNTNTLEQRNIGSSHNDPSAEIISGHFLKNSMTEGFLVYSKPHGQIFVFTHGDTREIKKIEIPGNSHSKVEQILTGDVNGDGTDEVILIRSYNKSKKDIYVIHIYDLFTMQGDKVLEAFSYKRDPIQKKPVFLPGDFNGDGKTEIIERVIDASTGYYNMYAHTGSGYQVATGNYPINESFTGQRFYTADLDGDGKHEIIISGDNFTSVCNYIKGNDGKFYFTERTRTSRSLGDGCSFCDYNGDGCADLQRAAYTQRRYKIFCKKHNTFLGETFTPTDTSIHESCSQCRYEGISAGTYITEDFLTRLPGIAYLAGDLYTDDSAGSPVMSVSGKTFNSPTEDIHLFYSVDIDCDNTAEVIHCCYKGGILYIEDNKQINVSPNFRITTFSNGLYILDDYRVFKYTRKKNLSRESLITTVIDSYGRILKTRYKSLSEISSTTGYKEYPHPFTAYLTHQYLPVGHAIMTSDEKIHSSFEYQYGHGVFHKEGLGFLGFSSFRAIDLLRGDEEIQDSDMSGYINALSQGRYPVETQNRSSFISNEPQHQNIDQTSVFVIDTDKTIKPVSSTKKIFDRITRITETQELLNYNENEAPELKRVTRQTSTNENIVSETEIEYSNLTKDEFTAYNLPREQTTILSRISEKDITVTEYKYSPEGNVIKESVTRNGEQERLTETAYDAYSNKISEETRHFTGSAKKTVYSYSDADRLLVDRITKTIEDGTVYDSESYEYDREKLFLLSMTDNLGKKTVYLNHDLSGEPTLVLRPDSTRTEISRMWVEINGENFIRETVRETNLPAQTSYTDIFGNTVRVEKEGIEKNDTIITQYRYDDIGRLRHESTPYRKNDEINWTQYIYDRADRITRIIYPDLTTKAISYQGNITRSTGGGITTSHTTDLNGKTMISGLNGITVRHFYRPDGQPRVKRAIPGGTVQYEYDALGRRTKLTDASAGETLWEYNREGQLYKKTRNGKSILYQYDSFGLLSDIQTPEFSVSCSYHPKSFQPLSIISSTGDKKTFVYDDLQRPVETKWEQDGLFYREKFSYGKDGLILSKELSDNRGIIGTLLYEYSDNSTLTDIRFSLPNGKTEDLWSLHKCNAAGQAEQYSTGYHIHRQEYDCMGRPVLVETANGKKIVRRDSYKYDSYTGQLIEKNIRIPETFEYDGFNQLQRAALSGKTKEYRYDKFGNIIFKPETGNMSYNGANPYAITEAENPEGLIPEQQLSVSYTSFDRPDTLSMGNKRLIFRYGPDCFRSSSRLYIDDVLTEENKYLAEGIYQKHVRTDTGNEKIYVYLDGTPYTATNVLEIDLANRGSYQIFRLFRDHLGSIIQARGNTAIGTYYYDPWGKLRDSEFGDISPAGREAPLLFGRGFSGHEHIREFGLINMNARLYDPLTGRFLSPDPYISDPDNPLAYNRYAYALNNPIQFNDPSGEFLGIAIGLNIGLMMGKAYCDGVKANHGKLNPFKWDWKRTNITVSAGYNTSGKISGDIGMGFNNNYMINAGWDNGVSVGYTLNGESRMAIIAPKPEQSERNERWLHEIRLMKSDMETAAVALVIPQSGYGAIAGLPKKSILGYELASIGVAYGVVSVAEEIIERQTRTYVTYVLSRPDGMKYVGRASGNGDPYKVMMNRYYHHQYRRSLGYGNPQLDCAAFGPDGKDAIRGREQQLIDHYGGIGSPFLGNSIRAVSKYNPKGRDYHDKSNLYFGQLAPYSGY